MKWKRQVTSIPEGDPIVGLAVAVRKVADRSTIMAPVTDAQGYVEVATSGHLEPIYMHLADVPGGDKFLRSDEIHLAGTACMLEVPDVLRSKGDKVTKGALSEFALTMTGGITLTVAPGAAIVGGYPYVNYAPITFTPIRPTTGTATRQIVLRIWKSGPTPGKAELIELDGTARVQDATRHEMSLYTLTVPNAGNITWTDDRGLTPAALPATVSGQVALAATNTSSVAGGPLPSMPVISLHLPDARVYDVTARLRVVQIAVSATSTTARGNAFANANLLSYLNPEQIDFNDSGNTIYVADTGNNRVLLLDLNGNMLQQIANRNAVTGVVYDKNGYAYIGYASAGTGYIEKYAANLTKYFWSVSFQGAPKHLATDGVYIYTTLPSMNQISKRRCSDGVLMATWGGSGTGPGQYNGPWGISARLSNNIMYVVDRGNNRVQGLRCPSGVYDHEFPVAADTRGIWVNETRSQLWVVNPTDDTLRRYSIHGGTPDVYVLEQTITESNPSCPVQTTGGTLWVTRNSGVASWIVFTTDGGYGEIAIDFGGTLSPYLGAGYRVGAISNVAAATITGPATVPITAYGKATAYQMSLQSLSMSATARPRG